MRYCSRCLYPENHPLHLTIDAEGVCSGCRVHEEKDVLDWTARRQKLAAIFDAYRCRSGQNYDCIIPVSGARDSFFIVHTVKREFGMNPLLVTYNKHYNSVAGIKNLSYLRTALDCDIVTLTLDPRLVRQITHASLDRLGSMYWHCLAGQSVFPVRAAVGYKVPLIVWGAHQGCDQVGMFSHTDEVEMTRKYRKEHDLLGLEAEDLVGSGGLTEKMLQPFFYPNDKEIEMVGVRGIYLGNYLRWDSKDQHERMLRQYNYYTLPLQRTFDTYNDVDCVHYSGVHDYIKFLKFGYGKVSDHASREIRFGRLTRAEGARLVRRYRDIVPADLPEFLNWIGLSEREFFSKIDAFRDPRVWERAASGEWRLKHCVSASENFGLECEGDLSRCTFASSVPDDVTAASNCQLLTRGLVDPTAPPARYAPGAL